MPRPVRPGRAERWRVDTEGWRGTRRLTSEGRPEWTRDLAAELERRMREDQRVRSRVGSTAAQALAEAWAIDADNTAWLRTVIDARGWPLRSQVGEQGALAAWLLVQHADDDVPFQRRCLLLLQQAVAAGEADRVHLAYLTDRVLRAEGRPQRNPVLAWARRSGPFDARAYRRP